MNDLLESHQVEGMQIKLRNPSGVGPFPVLLMLHGWTGDENSMWVFTRELPINYLIVSPRAPFPSRHPKYAGYSWVERHSGDWSGLSDFRPSIEKIANLMDVLSRQYEGDFTSVRLAGFSQGAALAYAFALRFPERVERLAALAGFLPEQSEDEISPGLLAGVPIFIAHGEKDETVPIAKAEYARDMLAVAGGNVSFCLSDVEHRLGSNCFKAFKEFMS